MAVLIPAINSCLGRMTSGERRLAYRLEEKLEDDYLCWFNVPVGKLMKYPDFIICHPKRGLLVLEVKDWKRETIIELNRKTARILTDKGIKSLLNPLEQARGYMHNLAAMLKRDPQLVSKQYGRKEQLIFPYGCGVVLTNITRKQFNEGNLGEVLLDNLVICQDEMKEGVDAEIFQKCLWDMFNYSMNSALSLPQIDRIRWNIFPEVRIPEQKSLFDNDEESTIPDIVRVMDMQQEQLARSLREGHRIIHGVAGSGKTMILGYRAEFLAPIVKRPVLVLCYNRALADSLAFNMERKNLADKVHVRTFHKWCVDQLKTYNIPLPRNENIDQFFISCVELVIQYADQGIIPIGQYDAILIDEGHDFEPEWFKLVVQMINPDSNTLLVLYDDAQSIYSKEKKKLKSFSSVGIQARGRTTILKLNYRNTVEVLAVAKAIAGDLLSNVDNDDDHAPTIEPLGAGSRGSVPLIIKLPTLKEEAEKIADLLVEQNNDGMAWEDMAVICRYKFIGNEIKKYCNYKSIPINGNLKDKGVYLITMHSSKGLEFPFVCIPAVGMPYKHEGSMEEEARLLYVAMTRATEKLVMTYGVESIFADRLSAIH